MFTQHRCSMSRKTVASTPTATCESRTVNAPSLQPVVSLSSQVSSCDRSCHKHVMLWEHSCLLCLILAFIFLFFSEERAVICLIVLRHLNVTRSRTELMFLRADAVKGVPWLSGLELDTTDRFKLRLSYCEKHVHEYT